jgi:MFS family permease
VLIAMPLYAVHLGGTEEDAGLMTLIFTMAALLGRLPVGWAMDRWGRRPILLAGAVVAIVSGVTYQVVARVPVLFVLRAFHGLAMSLFTTAVAAVISDLVPAARRGEGVGYWGMGSNLSLAISPIVALEVVGRYSFSALFLLSTTMALLALALGAAVRETGARRRVRFTLRLETLFVRSAVMPAIVMAALTMSHGAIVTLLPLMGQARALGNPGVFFTVAALVLVAVRAKAGALSDRLGRGPILVPGMLLAAASMAVVGLAARPAVLVAAGAMYGLGFGLAQPALMALVADRAADADRARAIATYYAGWELGIGLAGFGLAYVVTWSGFTAAFFAAGAASALGGIGYLATPGRPRLRPGPGDAISAPPPTP